MAVVMKSPILPWGWSNIQDAPDVTGVYVLRNASQNIIYIGSASAGRLRERLMEHYRDQDIPGVRYFDWYQTDSTEFARTLERAWIEKYRPAYNSN